MKSKLFFSFKAFFLYAALNILFYIIEWIFKLGFGNYKFYEIFIFPLGHCLILWLATFLIKDLRKLLWLFPLMILILKSLILIISNNMLHGADMVMSNTIAFSVLFDILQRLLQESGFQSNFTEILLHLVGMFCYQVIVLSLVWKVVFSFENEIKDGLNT